MSPGRRLSREQKGKSIATVFSPAKDADGAPLDDFDLVHREAMMYTRNMSCSQRVLVAESARLHREEMDEATARAQVCTRDGQCDARSRMPPIDFIPTTYFLGGIFDELPALPSDHVRSPNVEGQFWENVEQTRSTPGSVKAESLPRGWGNFPDSLGTSEAVVSPDWVSMRL